MRFSKIFLIQIFFFFFILVNSYSQVITDIKIIGNKVIQRDTLLNKINFNKGNNYSEEDLNLFQKKLFDTGFFEKVDFELSGSILNIKVLENPVIDFFYVYGDKNKDRINLIYDIVELKSGNLFSDFKLLNDVLKISELYKSQGFYEVKVEPVVKKVDGNKVNISIKISKNEQFKIKRIYFIGEKKYNSNDLLDVITSSESGWWKFLSNSSLLNENRVNYDKILLKKFYNEEGYYDAQIVTAKIDILPNNYANILYSINSGIKYNFGTIILKNPKVFNPRQIEYLNTIIKTLKNSFYSSKKTLLLKEKINDFLISNKFSNIDFKISEIKNNNFINLEIIFYEKKLPLIKNIIVKGNSITEEKVIRNNLIFSEGDFLTDYKINKSEDNINSINLFKNLKISKIPIDDNLTNIEILVEEKPTGSIMGGVGFGSNESAITFSVTEENLFGQNIKINTEMSIGTEKIIGNFVIANPDFKDSGRLVRNNFFIVDTNYSSVGYDSSMFGNDISTKYMLFENIDFNFGAGFDYDKINTSSSASSTYKALEGNYFTLKTFYGLSQDKRNRKFNTSSGHLVGFNQTIAVPGSDIPYLENNLFAKYYYPFSKDYTFNIRSGASSINSYGSKDVKLSNRLFLSNKQLRGFEPRSIGPIDGADHVGGNYSIYGGLSSTFPNPLPEKWNAKTIVFLDAGNVWGVDYDSSKDSNKIRSSAGLSLDWISPLGPISFTLSNAISKASTDKDQSFSFQIGSTF